jgi:hypothetical protein
MPNKKHKPEEIVGKLREVEIVPAQGASTAEVCRWIYLYGRLSLCKRHLNVLHGSFANIYPASAGRPECPNGESAHAVGRLNHAPLR